MTDSLYRTERRPGGVIAVIGELDMVSTDELECLTNGTGATLRLDLSEVSFIGSGALHVLVRARQRLGDGFVIVEASPVVRRLLDLTDLVGLLLPPPTKER